MSIQAISMKQGDDGFSSDRVNLLIATILSDKWLSMRKGRFVVLIIILIFSLPFTYGGCSGGGGGGGSESAADDAGIDVKLHVPYVPNYCNTCVTSSFTMVLKYYGTGAEFADVWNVVGYPADYEAFDYWIRNNWEPTPAFLIIPIDDPIP